MAKINLLDSKTYNKIAAGEVVERPASVVKELVENSIDAGAKNIKIEIKNGGIDLIKITDDGCGIEKDELPKALMAHATSKLNKIEDLDDLLTLGFRGEALASISSVSKIKITSKPSFQENGASIYTEGGLNTKLVDEPTLDGTVIEVKNLFFNVPARQKFLKTPRSEEGEITNIVLRLILGYPFVSFKFVADGETIHQSFGDGFMNAVVATYGAKIIEQCYFVDTIKNGLHIHGYFGKPEISKGNKSYQSLFINGRYVINSTVSSAIINAYSPYLMKRQYPFFVLNIDLPREIVDVNVHPTKADVRFSNNQVVYGSIYSVVSKLLNGPSEAVNIVTDDRDIFEIEKTTEKETVKINENASGFHENIVFNDPSINSTRGETVSKELNALKEEKERIDKKYADIFAENKAYLDAIDKKRAENQKKTEVPFVFENKSIPQIKTDINLKTIGQVLNTYLILEGDTDIYFIDQHAAHERIIYDKLIENTKNKAPAIQPLLVPFTMNLSIMERDFLLNKAENLKNIGIEIDEFGSSAIKVLAVPTFLTEMNFEKFFLDIIGEMNDLSDDKLPEQITEKLAQTACKSAIKSGDKLSDSEISALLNMLKGNMGLKCPHGRPVAVKITRTEIDKWFKRII